MSSGCAAMAMADLRCRASIFYPLFTSMPVPFVRVALGRTVCREDHFVGAQGVSQAGERHFMPCIQRGEERFKLRLIRMIRKFARIEHLHGKLAPFALVQPAEGG